MNSIIVTGSSRGIGSAIAKKWCMNHRDNFYYGISRWNEFDVSKKDVLDNLLNSIEDNPIALVNNAGIIDMGSIVELSYESWTRQFDVNVHGVFNCSKAYVNFCIAKKIKGKIINIASTAGLSARPGRSAYSATKAAIINFSLSMAEELRDYGIKVYCVCPGAIDTDMRRYINPDDDFENMLKPSDIADFVCDLINDGKHLDNQILKVVR